MIYKFFFKDGHPNVDIQAQGDEELRAAICITAIITIGVVTVVALKN